MNTPKIENILRDNENKILYRVMAYRSLSREELLTAVKIFMASSKKKIKRNTTITIISNIGYDE